MALGLLLAANLALWLLRRRFTPKSRRAIRLLLIAVVLIDEVGWQGWNIYAGTWRIQTMLPLHLCSAMIYVTSAALVFKRQWLRELAWFLGVGGALQALLTPELGRYGFPHFLFFQTISAHGALVAAGVFIVAVDGFRPTWQSIGRVAIIANVYMALVGLVNWTIGSNYLFIAHKPATASLLDFLGPWPWYILGLEGGGLLMVLILFAPFIRRPRRQPPA